MLITTLPSLEELSRLIREGEISPDAVVKGCLHRIRQQDNTLAAWAYLAEKEALKEAAMLTEELSNGDLRGPLHGIPFGVKDIFDTAGVPTEWGSPLYAGRVPSTDAELVARLRRAGAIMLGKTHTTAFAYFDAGPTRNPHNLLHTPGGSSSGSAAAVAGHMVPFALGSQTLGSVLRPAAFCGIAGFKPSFERLPLGGVLAFAKSLDHAGFFTRTVSEMAFLWRAVGGQIAAGGTEKPLAAVPWPPGGGVEPEMQARFDSCCERLTGAGFAIEQASLPESFKRLPEATRTVMAYEGARFHRSRFQEHGAKVGAKLAELVEKGLAIQESAYHAALEAIEQSRADYAAQTEKHPVWITPAAPGPAPEGLEFTGDPRCNAPFTALGVPALSMPFATSDKGLPLGLQLTAAAGREDLLLATALECERALS